jgi:hypothetical protein
MSVLTKISKNLGITLDEPLTGNSKTFGPEIARLSSIDPPVSGKKGLKTFLGDERFYS